MSLQHLQWPVYRCSLPGLTGFTGLHRTGPGSVVSRFALPDLGKSTRGVGFGPAVAGCRYRAPLAPHLARPLASFAAKEGWCHGHARRIKLRAWGNDRSECQRGCQRGRHRKGNTVSTRLWAERVGFVRAIQRILMMKSN